MCNVLQIQSELGESEGIERGETVKCTTCLTLLVRKVLIYGNRRGGGEIVYTSPPPSPLRSARVCKRLLILNSRSAPPYSVSDVERKPMSSLNHMTT